MTRAAWVAACLLLASCGFHLSGTRPLPDALSSVYIDVITPYRVSKPHIESALHTALVRRGAIVADKERDARSVLRLSDLADSVVVLSVDPAGKAVEYQLTTRVRYELTVKGKPLVRSDEMRVSRDYSFNAQQVLAKEAEEARLQDYMQEELASLLLLRLESLLNRPAAVPEAAPGATPAP